MARKGVLTEAEALPIAEFTRLLECLRRDGKYKWECYCYISFCTACRVSDVLTIRWIDILNRDELMKTERKTGKTRLIRFNSIVKAKITELYDLLGRPDKNSLVICNPRTKRAYSVAYVNRTLKAIVFRYKIDIKRFSTHSFRKTFGRFVYESMGRSPEAIVILNRIFQHSSIKITMAYIGLQQEEVDQAYASIKF